MTLQKIIWHDNVKITYFIFFLKLIFLSLKQLVFREICLTEKSIIWKRDRIWIQIRQQDPDPIPLTRIIKLYLRNILISSSKNNNCQILSVNCTLSKKIRKNFCKYWWAEKVICHGKFNNLHFISFHWSYIL